jgi:hypothetical protein
VSALSPVGYPAWLRAAHQLEDAGEVVCARGVAQILDERLAGSRRMLARLRDKGYLASSHGKGTYRLAAPGRWLLGLPVLVYLASPIDTIDPWDAGDAAIDATANLVACIGPPAVALAASCTAIGLVSDGAVPDAIDALAAIARRADVVVVVGDDPLTESRADVVAAERADALIVVATGASAAPVPMGGAYDPRIVAAAALVRRALGGEP